MTIRVEIFIGLGLIIEVHGEARLNHIVGLPYVVSWYCESISLVSLKIISHVIIRPLRKYYIGLLCLQWLLTTCILGQLLL